MKWTKITPHFHPEEFEGFYWLSIISDNHTEPHVVAAVSIDGQWLYTHSVDGGAGRVPVKGIPIAFIKVSKPSPINFSLH